MVPLSLTLVLERFSERGIVSSSSPVKILPVSQVDWLCAKGRREGPFSHQQPSLSQVAPVSVHSGAEWDGAAQNRN